MISHFRRAQLCESLWTVARQAPPSRGFSRQEYWNNCHFILQGNLPNPGVESGSPELQADSLPSEPKLAFNLTNTNLNSHSPTYYLFYLGQVT